MKTSIVNLLKHKILINKGFKNVFWICVGVFQSVYKCCVHKKKKLCSKDMITILMTDNT